MTMPATSLDGLRSLAEGEGQQIWARVPYILNLEETSIRSAGEGGKYYVLRTHASARIPDWPTIPDGTGPESGIEVILLPGAAKTVTIKLLTVEELESSGDGNRQS